MWLHKICTNDLFRISAILSIYFKSKLHFSEDTSTVIYHTFSMLCYFTPIFGAMLADQFFGKFRYKILQRITLFLSVHLNLLFFYDGCVNCYLSLCYRTIFWISLIYVLGHALKTLAAIPTLGLPPA